MAIKILVNAEAGFGKTSLLASLDEKSFVISRDSKDFGLELPHFLVNSWTDMETFLYGSVDSDGDKIDGVVDKIEKYNDKFGRYPETIAIDSVSQIFMDVIDKASQTKNVYGSQGAEVTSEMAKLTKFIHEELEMSGMDVIMLNHVIQEKLEGKPTGAYLSFGAGKFLEKKGFYSTVNEAITIEIVNGHRRVTLSGAEKLARTTLTELPTTMWLDNPINPSKSKKLKEDEEYYNLKWHLDLLKSKQSNVSKYAI